MNTLFFLQIRQEKICTKIDLVTRSCFFLCLLKTIIVSAFLKKTLFFILPKIYLSRQISGRIPVPDIRPDIRQKQYPVSGASLLPNGNNLLAAKLRRYGSCPAPAAFRTKGGVAG
jgi:hypothetical protein